LRDNSAFLKPGMEFESDGVPFPDLLTHVTKSRKVGGGYLPPKGLEKFAMVTVHDQPHPSTLERQRQLDTMGSKVVGMSASFKTVTDMKAGKAEVMDQMHEHSLAKVEDVRVHMEEILADIGEQIGEFTVEWTTKRDENMDMLDAEMREKMVLLNKRYQRLEERALRLNAAIEEETASRIRDTQALMIPVNKTVERLTTDLETEREIRETREKELMKHLEESVAILEDSNQTEAKNRVERHAEAVKEYTNGKNNEKEAVKRPGGFERLQKRHSEIGVKSHSLVTAVYTDLDNERALRIKGQDHITSKINEFIARFQSHVLEEGDVGN